MRKLINILLLIIGVLFLFAGFFIGLVYPFKGFAYMAIGFVILLMINGRAIL